MTQDNKYDLLQDELIAQEINWMISLYLEKFNCKNNKLPCQNCRNTAQKLTPFFLHSMDIIATQLVHHPRALTSMVLDYLAKTRWGVKRPWKMFQVPSPMRESQEIVIDSPVDLEKSKVSFKLVQRHKPK